MGPLTLSSWKPAACMCLLLLSSCTLDTTQPNAQDLVVVFAEHDAVTTEDVPPLCTPGEATCTALLESQVCHWDGQSWDTVACKSNEVCQADWGGCVPVMCQPFTTECTADQSLRTCSPDGLAWEAGSCDDDHFCTEGYCLYGRCLGHVLLLIDRSSSMKPHWQSVRQSVLNLVSSHDEARFGVMVFPGDEKCTVPEDPAIPLTAFGKEEVFEAFFNAYGPSISTPLLGGLKRVRQNLDSIFGDQKGIVVVISDGEDTCQGNKQMVANQLKNETQALSDAGVQTYVIGYKYQGDTAQLEAIAGHGNTGRDSYIKAGNENELDDAFKGIVSDIKLCL
jgi:hypothetical protein